MYDILRRLCLCLVALGTVLVAWPARAWVETQIVSDVVTLDIGADGWANVAHELELKVRGGPLLAYEVDGIDSDALPTPGATIERKASGTQATTALPLLLHRGDDGSLRLEIDSDRGLRYGSYVFRFGYRTNLKERGLLQPEGSVANLRWVSPRFVNGVDSMKVVLRMPPGDMRPQLPNGASTDFSTDLDNASGGVFLASVRRSASKDEVELVRPHVAKGEPVVWRIQTSGRAFGFSPADDARRAVPALLARSEAKAVRRNGLGLLLSGLVAFAFATLVFVKAQILGSHATRFHATVRGILPGGPTLRSLAAGLFLGASVLLVWRSVHIVGACSLAILAMLFAGHRALVVRQAPRGPGRWLPLHPNDVFAVSVGRARLLDATTLAGAATLALTMGALVAVRVLLLKPTMEANMTLALLLVLLLPVFLSGRVAQGPVAVAVRGPIWLKWLAQRLQADDELRLSPWARLPDAASEPDEIRLRVMPRKPRAGLLAIEIALQAPHGVLEPCLVIRARDGSDSYQALAQFVGWVRGRRPGERVVIVHPKLPTRRMTLALARRMILVLSRPEESGNGSSVSRVSPLEESMGSKARQGMLSVVAALHF